MAPYEDPPDRSLEQRMIALDIANAIRHDRAVAKKAIKAREMDPFEAITSELFKTAYVRDVLKCVPSFGTKKADRMMNTVRIAMSKTCAGLTDRQLTELRDLLCPYSNEG